MKVTLEFELDDSWGDYISISDELLIEDLIRETASGVIRIKLINKNKS